MAVDPCDAAFWDLSGTLLGDLRTKLKRRTAHQGGKIVVESGEWLGQRLVVGMPKRLIRRHAPPLAESVAALVAAHRPRRVFVVGPAASASETVEVGHVVIAEETGAEAIGDGTIQPLDADPPPVTTDWAADCRRATDALGVQLGLIAVVTVPFDSSQAVPPPSHRRTRSRDAGAFIGKLLAGRSGTDSKPAVARAAVVETVEALLRRT